MDPGAIRIVNAKEHNLRGLSVSLQRGALIGVCGVSGSGKSTLLLDVLYAEAERRMLEALGSQHAARLPRPKVDAILGLPPTIGFRHANQPTAGTRTSVGLYLELADVLASVFALAGTAHCPLCDVALPMFTSDQAVAKILSDAPPERATILAELVRGDSARVRTVLPELRRQGYARVLLDGSLTDLDPLPTTHARDLDLLVDRLRVDPEKATRWAEAIRAAYAAGSGVVHLAFESGPAMAFADHPHCPDHGAVLPAWARDDLDLRVLQGNCPTCRGVGCATCHHTRRSAAARAVRLEGASIADLEHMPIQALESWRQRLSDRSSLAPLLAQLDRRTELLARLGLGSLPLGRAVSHLSSGEQARLRLAKLAAVPLDGVLALIDEPDVALEGTDIDRVFHVLRELQHRGDTVVVVAHNIELLRQLDHLIELGPGAGPGGGNVIAEAAPNELSTADTPTGRALRGSRDEFGVDDRPEVGRVVVDASAIGVGILSIPTHRLVVLTGPSGVGKSRTLRGPVAEAFTEAFPGAVRIEDGRPLKGSKRSCLATHTDLWSPLRALLAETQEARVRGLSATHFSFNSPGGRCEACKGTGTREAPGLGLGDVVLPCEACSGQRFRREVRGVSYRGLDVNGLLDLTVSAARQLFSAHRRLAPRLRSLDRAGLGYLRLGQATATLSSGEALRLRLAEALDAGPDPTVLLLDAPTRGLHPEDQTRLATLLVELATGETSVICADNSPWLARATQHVVQLSTMGATRT